MEASGDGSNAARGHRETPPPAPEGSAAPDQGPAAPPDQTARPDQPGPPGKPTPDEAKWTEARGHAKATASTLLGAVVTAVGTAVITYFQHDPPLLFIALGLVVCLLCAQYFAAEIDQRLRAGLGRLTRARPQPRRPAHGQQPGQPAASRPLPLVAAVLAATAAAFLVGYWVIGECFAHGTLPGTVCLLGLLAAAVLLTAWLRRGRDRPARARSRLRSWLSSWLRSRRFAALVAAVAALGLSAGATLGADGLAPAVAAAAAARCPPPAELRVLASAEILSAVQAAIPVFERQERSVLRQPCYAVDLTAYAAPSDAAAGNGLTEGWSLATDGPHPDIWIPASSAELSPLSTTAGGPTVQPLGSVASSPIVVAVPTALAGPVLAGGTGDVPAASLYQSLAEAGLGLQVPSPRLSETGLLGLADLYQDLPGPAQRQIEQSGSFPPDSGSLLCAAAQAAQAQAQAAQAQAQAQAQQAAGSGSAGGRARPAGPSAYLVSEAAVAASNAGRLNAAACAATSSTAQLTAFYPAGGTRLDFPFTTVTWPGSPAGATAKAGDEHALYAWLTGPAGRAVLSAQGLRAPAPANLPSAAAVATAANGFAQGQPAAHILVAVDDSGPMQPYLTQVTAAVSAAVGTRSQGGLGGKDSIGVWAFPGGGATTSRVLVPFGPVTAAQRARVAGDVAGLVANGHSAQFNLLAQAAQSLVGAASGTAQAAAGSASSVILLTDGDSYWPTDPGSSYGTFSGVRELYQLAQPGGSRLRVFVIAFGPPGCAESPSGQAAQSLEALAADTGGTCWNAAGADPAQLLGQVISQLSAGG